MPRLRHYARAPFLSRFRLIALLTCQEGRGTLCHVAQRRAVLLLQTGPLENFFSISSPFVSNGRNRADVPLISSLLFRLRSQNPRLVSLRFAIRTNFSPLLAKNNCSNSYRLESNEQRWNRSHARLIARITAMDDARRVIGSKDNERLVDPRSTTDPRRHTPSFGNKT